MKMKSWMQAIVAGLVFAVCAGQVGAETFTIEGRKLEVPLPAGFCKVEETGEDAVLRNALNANEEPDGKVLMVVLDCKDHAKWRADPRLLDIGNFAFGKVALMAKDGKPRLIGGARSEFFGRAAGLPAALERELVRRKVEDWMRADGSKDVTGHTMVGIGEADENGLYMLSTANTRANGKQFRYVQTMAMSIVNDLGVTWLMNDPVDARSTLGGILAEQKRNLAALVAANTP